MMSRNPIEKSRHKCWITGFVLIIAIPFILLIFPIGRGLANLSYDLPFFFRGNISDSNVVVLVEDRAALDTLGYPTFPPPRTVHAQLVDRLRELDVRLIVFDISFRTSKPDMDELFAEAIQRHGHVILGGVVESTSQQLGDSAGASIVEIKPPTDVLRAAAADWGLLVLDNSDPNLGVRKIVTQWRGVPSAPWLAAQHIGVISADENPANKRWINFYGPSPALDQVTLGEVLEVDGRKMPKDFLRGKVVFVGFDSSVTPASGKRDVFATPFTRLGKESTPGVEILANIYANLANRDWLRRMPLIAQCSLSLIFGGFAFVAFVFSGRRWMWLTMPLACLLIVSFSILLQWRFHWWWNWMVPTLVQIPLVAAVALLYPRRPMVAFISYRRAGGKDFAALIHEGLRARGYNAFLDVHDISIGEWWPQLKAGIDRSRNFILILSPGMFVDETLEQSDWVYEEIRHAMTTDKNIIPIILEEFEYPATLPPGMDRLPKIQTITHDHSRFEFTLDELLNRYMKR